MSDNRSTLKEFFASIATIKGDLSNITAPPFVLAPQSTVEFPAYWAERPSVFVAAAASDDPAKRALLVLKWFLSALKGQQYAGRNPSDGIKKPLNAFLGELFLAEWNDASGKTQLVSEQVSHHPPVTACCLWNDDAGVKAEGYTCQEITASVSGSVHIRQIGHAILHLDKHNEDYLVPIPDVKVKGILTGTPYPELNGTYYIASSSGFHSKIDFSGRGLFHGKKNSFQASVFRNGDEKSPIYEIEGQWTEKFTIRDVATSKDIESFDTNVNDRTPLSVPAVQDQDPWESRRAWAGVIDALNHSNMQATVDEKSKVEEAQRAMRKREEEQRSEWQPLFFQCEKDDSTFRELARGTGEELHADLTKGVWKSDWKALKESRKPFRGNMTPLG
ncbi:Oxysterol-binding protein [Rhizodiscina lignyota]|uniref:Oxysterol-binding protein n=1 Tax=Rhizodiscina lignyota TaxID=1504668 RepID=A0A9P4MA41_9PEZI|nr:Oxysterol-binding protein [Rhizodiscina lignyota]